MDDENKEGEQSEEKNAIHKRLEFMASKCDVGGVGEGIATSGQLFLCCYWAAVDVIAEIGIDDPVSAEALDVAKILMSRLNINVNVAPQGGGGIMSPDGLAMRGKDGQIIRLN